tara:strand:- start:386 stop:1372 length:987 start_codon:yes stop_codon:yes gene_type:complete
MSIVKETLLQFAPIKRKQTPSGWISFNAPCCHHNGTSADTRGRGGLIGNTDGGISYHCFNCGYKASWQPGRNLSYKMKNLMKWFNAPDDVITKLALDVMKLNEGETDNFYTVQLPTFVDVELPQDAKLIKDIENDIPTHLLDVLKYMKERNLYLDDYNFYWSPSLGYRDRLIIPFYYNKKIVGFTARTFLPNKRPKYLSNQQPGYVFNFDEQRPEKIFVIVCEGPIDAIHVEGVAVLGSEIKDQQVAMINSLNKQVIVVPDKDKAGSKMIETALEQGWSVSMPDWGKDINDIGDCVKQHGKLYTLYSIVNNSESSKLKIQLREKQWLK